MTVDRLSASDGSLCLRDAAKNLKVRPIDQKKWLIANRWIYQRAGVKNWFAYQDKIQSGYMEHKVTVISRDEYGIDKTSTQVLVTAKGLAKLSLVLEKP